MFEKRFPRRFLAPAWAGEGPSGMFLAHNWGGPSGSSWGPRHRRGDVKFLLLGLLAQRPQHGYELIKALEARHNRRLSPGSVYPTLQMLEESGCLTSEPIDGKRVYTITAKGRQLLSERGDPFPQDATADPTERRELRRALMDLNDAVAQVAREGERINQVRDLLNQAKREIYRILSQP